MILCGTVPFSAAIGDIFVNEAPKFPNYDLFYLVVVIVNFVLAWNILKPIKSKLYHVSVILLSIVQTLVMFNHEAVFGREGIGWPIPVFVLMLPAVFSGFRLVYPPQDIKNSYRPLKWYSLMGIGIGMGLSLFCALILWVLGDFAIFAPSVFTFSEATLVVLALYPAALLGAYAGPRMTNPERVRLPTRAKVRKKHWRF